MRKSLAFILIALILSSLVPGQVPQLPDAKPKDVSESVATDKPSPGVHPLTEADVEAFLEGIVPLQLQRDDIAGAVVTVVKDGKLLFAKGYGYSDVASKKPVSVDETLFRPGSVSKLFTWTAVMQMVEQGKLDLNRDVNEYLDFKIPDAFDKPITLKDILTHTPGFEEQIKDLFSFDPTSPNLGDYVKTHIPRRIYAPGTTPAYSNYGTALAGYIVERVSGQPFNDYIAEHIFKPLGMTRSTFAQPLPADLAPLMSNGYKQGSDEAQKFEMIGAFPAGSLSSPAGDMAKFMLAHLQEGELNGARILKSETARQMHSRLFGLDDAANGMAHGFYEESRNGRRIIGHGGDTIQFHSDLHLVLEEGVGFFVSYNSAGKGQVSGRSMLWDSFMDRYFPDTRADQPTLESSKADAQAVAGSYMVSRRPEGSFLRSIALLGEATVYPNEDGTVSVDALTDPNGKPKRWREVAPMTFRDVNGQDVLVFKPDQSGRMQLIVPYPFMAFHRVGVLENGKILLPVVGLSLLIMLLTLVLWPISWFVRRHYGHKLELSAMDWKLRLGERIVFALNLIFIIGLAVIFSFVEGGRLELFSDAGLKWIYLLQFIGVIGAVGTLLVLYNAFRAWTGSQYKIWGKLRATLFVLVCLGFLWFAFVANMYHFTSTY